MARLTLGEVSRSDSIAILGATLGPQAEPACISYDTRTGALLRVDGTIAGAFDREHHEVVLMPSNAARTLHLEVERQSLPTNGLPSGPGLVWWMLNARSHPSPQRFLEVADAVAAHPEPGRREPLPLVGHSHLDVAWLWTYEDTRRKALRTFAIAADLLDAEPEFIFAQSQPQLYAFVEEGDAELFGRIGEFVAAGRFDPDFAALWVEPDCNLPSGESLLRHMQYAHRYCVERFGVEPGIAWLPDSFGFANTLPMLFAHAGIRFFGTTKLQWNDTTRFPYPQFVWRAPDGSEVTAALINSMEGGLGDARIAAARERREPLVTGYGDGGGGVTREILVRARDVGTWIRPRSWFEEIDARRSVLPVHADELYLEYHRGVYTTMHAIKEQNALLERALAQAEELVAWCVAVRAPQGLLADLRARLRAAWEIVLCNQFHDVLPGTSIQAVHDDALALYGRAGEVVASVLTAAAQSLPRAPRHTGGGELVAPSRDNGEYVLDNGLIRVRITADGTIVGLTLADGPSVCNEGNVLAMYEDRPKEWDAWNIDASYASTRQRCPARDARVEDGALHFAASAGNSRARMRMVLFEGEPFVRVELNVAWKERHRLLRVENTIPFAAPAVRYGTPHGSIARDTAADTPQQRAKFEVPGQRYALAAGASGAGFAMLALNTYGWSARADSDTQLGHSLVRSTTWPDPVADRGEQVFSYAFAPLASGAIGAVERLWERFACEPRVRLFTCENERILVVACKPAEDGDGVIVRVRECDGVGGSVCVRSGGRMREAVCVDGLERPATGTVNIEDESLRFEVGAFAIRSFRVRF